MSSTWCLVKGTWSDEHRAVVSRWGYAVTDEPAKANIHLSVTVDPAALSISVDSGVSAQALDERFRIQVSDWAPLRIDLVVAGERGVRTGLNAIRRGLLYGQWPDAQIGRAHV